MSVEIETKLLFLIIIDLRSVLYLLQLKMSSSEKAIIESSLNVKLLLL